MKIMAKKFQYLFWHTCKEWQLCWDQRFIDVTSKKSSEFEARAPGRFQLQKIITWMLLYYNASENYQHIKCSRALLQIIWRGHWRFSPSNPGFESQWFLILSIALRAKNQMCLHRLSEPKNSSNNLGKTILTTMAILSIVILLNLLDLNTTHFCFYWYFISKIYWTSIKTVGIKVIRRFVYNNFSNYLNTSLNNSLQSIYFHSRPR